MKRLLILTLLGLVGLMLTPARSSALVLTPYDNFAAGLIDPNKWFGSEGQSGAATPNADEARLIIPTAIGNQLALVQFSYGSTADNTGQSPGGSLRLNISNPNPVVYLQADVTVLSALAQPCAANTTNGTAVQAGLRGEFFNDGTSGGAGDQTGDVIAGLLMNQNSLTGLNQIVAFVERCTDAGCNNQTTVGGFVFFTTSWIPGQVHTLVVWWDPPNKQFIFVVDPTAPGAEVHAVVYPFATTNLPASGVKQLRVRNAPANCTAGRVLGFTFGTFGNVVIGQ